MSSLRGRTDDMLIIRGVNVYPTQVAEVLSRVAELSPHYQLVVSRERTMDEVEVRAEASDDFFRAARGEADRAAGALGDRVSGLIKDTIGCSMKVSIVAPGSVPRSEGGKLARVLDTRPRG
jgi:phenylacetate-CoA ligase